MVETKRETLDDILEDYKSSLGIDDDAWIDIERLRIIRALKYEEELRDEIWARLANGLRETFERDEQQRKLGIVK